LVKPEQREALQRDTVGATRERMVREICETLEAITVDGPLVVVLEDLHWADPSTLDVVSACARRQGPSRLLLVGTHRPAVMGSQAALSRLHQDLVIHDLCAEIDLKPFDVGEVTEFLSLEFGPTGVADDLAGSIHRHSAGNPLFVAALVRDLVTSGVVVRHDDSWKLTAPVDRIEPGVPVSLQEMLDVQFDQLSNSERRALRRASAIGERFPAWVVAQGPAEI